MLSAGYRPTPSGGVAGELHSSQIDLLEVSHRACALPRSRKLGASQCMMGVGAGIEVGIRLVLRARL